MSDVRGLFVVCGDPGYPSNQVLSAVLRRFGARPLAVDATPVRRWPAVARTWRRDLGRDATVVVAYPAHRRAFALRLAMLGRGMRMITVPLVLLHDSRIEDRREVTRRSPRAFAYRVSDRLLSWCSDVVVADTATHARWMSSRLGRPVASARLGSVVELADTPTADREFDGVLRLVHYGNFFPIQGAQYMLDAVAALDSSVVLELIGDPPPGLRLPPNVRAHGRLGLSELIDLMARCDGLLGQFGATAQRERVVPTKVYDALALGLPVVTAENAELTEVADGLGIRLTRPADSADIESAIRSLLEDAAAGRLPDARAAASGLYRRCYDVEGVADDWRALLATPTVD